MASSIQKSTDGDIDQLCQMMSSIKISCFSDDKEIGKEVLVFNKAMLQVPQSDFWAFVTRRFLSEKNIVSIAFNEVGTISRATLHTMIVFDVHIAPQSIFHYAKKLEALYIDADSFYEGGFTPLHIAVINNQIEQLRLHLATTPLDAVDKRGRTALHIAAYIGNRPIVQELVQHGASVTFCTPHYGTAHTQAICGSQQDVAALLLEHENTSAMLPKPDAISILAQDLFAIKHSRGPNYQQRFHRALYDSRRPGLLRDYYTYETALRSIYHSWKIDWKVDGPKLMLPQKIFYMDGPETFLPAFLPKYGGCFPFFMRKMAKATAAFIKELSADPQFPLEGFSLLKETLYFGSDQNSMRPEALLRRYRKYKPLLLGVMFNNPPHCTAVLIWKNMFFLCNRGFGSRRSVEVSLFNPRKLSLPILKKLKDDICSYADFTKLLFSELRTQLEMRKTAYTIKLEALLTFSAQDIGNCSWENIETGAYCLLTLCDEERQISKENNWLAYQQLARLKKYLDVISKPSCAFVSNYSMSYELYQKFERMKGEAWLHPILRKKMKCLEETYPILSDLSLSHPVLH